MEQNNLLTHGLLSEDFKQNILKLIQEHPLDIQTKAIILDCVLLSVNMLAKQQTETELKEYQKSKENTDDLLSQEASS